MLLENSEQQRLENEALKKRIAELECEVKRMKGDSTTTGTVINIPLSSDSHEFVVNEAKKQNIHVGEYLRNLVMTAVDEIMPYLEAFEIKDDSELSQARQELWGYLEPICDMQDLFSLMARAEISPNEQLNDRSEKSYQTTIGLMLELLTKPRNEGGKAPFDSETLVIQRISEKAIYGQGKTKLGERFKDAKDRLADEKKKTIKTTPASFK